jgi:hypothetical protein
LEHQHRRQRIASDFRQRIFFRWGAAGNHLEHRDSQQWRTDLDGHPDRDPNPHPEHNRDADQDRDPDTHPDGDRNQRGNQDAHPSADSDCDSDAG